MILEHEERARVAETRHGIDAIAEIDTDKGGGDDAEGQQPLEDAGSFAASGRGEALGEVERDDDADESTAHALEEPAEEERCVSVRKRYDQDALTMKDRPLRIIRGLRPIQSASMPAKRVEKTLPSRTAATMMESCDGSSLEVASR